MIKKLTVCLGLGLFALGMMTSNVGCSGPGEVVEGKATNKNFAKSGDKDEDGNEAPDGTARVD